MGDPHVDVQVKRLPSLKIIFQGYQSHFNVIQGCQSHFNIIQGCQSHFNNLNIQGGSLNHSS